MLDTVRYAEFVPAEPLRPSVRALFSFAPAASPGRAAAWSLEFPADSRLCAPTFAGSCASLLFSFDQELIPRGHWRSCPLPRSGWLVGPVTGAAAAPLDPLLVEGRGRTVGAYLRPGSALPGVPLRLLRNRIVPLDDLWGPAARTLWAQLCDLPGDDARLRRLEQALLERLLPAAPPSPLARAATLLHRPAAPRIEHLAQACGWSRQYFRRRFEEALGLPPKLYSELARFERALAWTPTGDWARAAAESGYSDQSHLIAEFRRFSGLTPEQLRRGRWFHPFLERAARSGAAGAPA